MALSYLLLSSWIVAADEGIYQMNKWEQLCLFVDKLQIKFCSLICIRNFFMPAYSESIEY